MKRKVNPKEPFKVNYKEATVGDWSIIHFEIPKEPNLEMLRMMRDGRGCRPGKYTKLHHAKRGVIMSDTDAEVRDHYGPYMKARELGGRILIHGLGLGSILQAVLTCKDVTHVDVVEIDEDVIKLIGPYFEKDKRVHIHHADAFTKKWPKGTRWNVVWHDIWDTICLDNKPEITKLMRKFGRRSDWQSYWAKHVLDRQMREERSWSMTWGY